MNEISQKNMRKVYFINYNNDAVYLPVAHQDPMLFRFYQNICESSISDSIAFNRTKFFMPYTYFPNDMDTFFCV